MFLLELRGNVACCILFEIHIDLGIEYVQNTDKVYYTLVLQTLESNYKVYLLVCYYFCRSYLSFYELGQYRHVLSQQETHLVWYKLRTQIPVHLNDLGGNIFLLTRLSNVEITGKLFNFITASFSEKRG